LDQRDIRLHSALGAAGDSMITAALFVPFIRGTNATVSKSTHVVVRTAGDERFLSSRIHVLHIKKRETKNESVPSIAVGKELGQGRRPNLIMYRAHPDP
jgi:hypothetical protein